MMLRQFFGAFPSQSTEGPGRGGGAGGLSWEEGLGAVDAQQLPAEQA